MSELNEIAEKLTEEEINEYQEHWYQVGRSSMASDLANKLLEEAKILFANGKDQDAKYLRDLSKSYNQISKREHPNNRSQPY